MALMGAAVMSTAYPNPGYDRLLAADPSVGPTGVSTRMKEYAEHKATLTLGSRVTVRPVIPNLGGLQGTITEVGYASGEFAVTLDGWHRPLGFYGYELVSAPIKTVTVTRAQVAAAKLMVKRAERGGPPASAAVVAIAGAKLKGGA